MASPNKQTGNAGETLAAEWLSTQGFTILHRNWRHSHWEIDIIASKGNILHFVEVKTRRSLQFGLPEESITINKMSALKQAAEEYLYQFPAWKHIQFDTVAIVLKGKAATEIFFIEDVYF